MLWFVYATEYPDEGSTVVEAPDEERALVAVVGSGIEADAYSVRRVTVADVEKLQDVADRAGLPKRRVGEAWSAAVTAWADEKLREVWAALASTDFLFGDLEFERSRCVILARKVDELARKVDELEAAARWIPLAEQLPPQDDETDVEVADFRLPECPEGAIALLSSDGHWVPEGAALTFKPTHWRHLGPSYEAIRAQADEDGVWRHRLAP